MLVLTAGALHVQVGGVLFVKHLGMADWAKMRDVNLDWDLDDLKGAMMKTALLGLDGVSTVDFAVHLVRRGGGPPGHGDPTDDEAGIAITKHELKLSMSGTLREQGVPSGSYLAIKVAAAPPQAAGAAGARLRPVVGSPLLTRAWTLKCSVGRPRPHTSMRALLPRSE